jgi:hypothetical protein
MRYLRLFCLTQQPDDVAIARLLMMAMGDRAIEKG